MSTLEHVRSPREEEAHQEVGRTAITPGVARTLVGGFLLLSCIIPGFELTHVIRGDETAQAPWARLRQIPSDVSARLADASGAWRRLVSGNRAVLEGLHDFEDALEDKAKLGQLLRPRTQAFLSGSLGAGNEQVYPGREDWLFFRRDVDAITSRGFLDPDLLERRGRSGDEWTPAPQPDPRLAILQFKEALGGQGITLIVLPVPVKPTIHPERLARGFASATIPPVNPDHERLVRELRAAGVQVVDPTALLYQTAQAGATQYLGTDTHWRPEAMEAVAQFVADAIRAARVEPVDDPGYRAQAEDITTRGDVFTMLDLPPRQTLVPVETVTIRRITAADGSPWRSSRDADILVLGDSFSNIYSLDSMGWGTSAGFVEQLSFALRRPIDRIVQNDAGAYATREILQREWDERLKGKKVVVWQFATRELVFGDWRVY